MIWCVEDDASIRDIELYTLFVGKRDTRSVCGNCPFFQIHRQTTGCHVILDVMLPGMDGVELLRRMKAAAHLADIPVIMATAGAF